MDREYLASTRFKIVGGRGGPNNDYTPEAGQLKFPEDAVITNGLGTEIANYRGMYWSGEYAWRWPVMYRLPMIMPFYTVYLTHNRESGFYDIFNYSTTISLSTVGMSLCSFFDWDLAMENDRVIYRDSLFPNGGGDQPNGYFAAPTRGSSFNYTRDGKTVGLALKSSPNTNPIKDYGVTGAGIFVRYAHTEGTNWQQFKRACWEVVFGKGLKKPL